MGYLCGRLPGPLGYGCNNIVLPVPKDVQAAVDTTDDVRHPTSNADCWLYSSYICQCDRCCYRFWGLIGGGMDIGPSGKENLENCMDGCVKFVGPKHPVACFTG